MAGRSRSRRKMEARAGGRSGSVGRVRTVERAVDEISDLQNTLRHYLVSHGSLH